MSDRFLFHDVLQPFVAQSGHSLGQLSRAAGIPKATIANWLQGHVRKPRKVTDLLKLAAALHLDEAEASHLLVAAGYPPLERLRGENNGADAELFAPWPPSGSEARAPFQAIADLATFTGRESELEALAQALLQPHHETIYILHGMGGVGKTTLAAHLAYRLRAHFSDGVLWASPRRTDPMAILLALASALGHDVGAFTDVGTRSAVVRDILADRRVLIVLDDAGSSEEVRPLLPPSGPAAVLITTRQRNLGATWGVRAFQIGPFAADGTEALELFARILGRERVQQERKQFVEMGHLLGNLPLAIAVAACRLAHESNWATADFLERLHCEQQRLDQLASGQESVRLSFNLSFEALSPEQQRLFSALGALGGEDFGVEAAAHCAALPLAVTADLLRELFNLSLVQQGRPGRYRLHPLLRDFARERARPPVIDEALFERAVGYFLDFVDANEIDFVALDREIGNITEVLAIAHERQMLPEVVRGVNALFPYLATRGLSTMAPLQLSRAIAAARGLGDARSLMTALHRQGQIERLRGNFEQATIHLNEGLALAGELNESSSLSALMSELVLVEQMRTDDRRADRYYRGRRGAAQAGDEPPQASTVLLGLGLFKLARGNCREADGYLQSGLRLARAAGDPVESSSLLLALGMAAYRAGNYHRAVGYLSEALSMARETGYGAVHAAAVMGLGIVTGRRGAYAEAQPYVEEGLALSRAVGRSWAVGGMLSEWGNVCLDLGETGAAAAAFEEALQIARATRARGLIGEVLYGLARLAIRRDDLAEAVRLARESVVLLRETAHYKAGEVEEWLDTLDTPDFILPLER
ncbi:MAG: tetratricopeptide repeat protein [Candidatus Promineifilaceae bacterium]|nr:tetratricopeptide repeat protein [Candidatus Promineifilaceae bacterium]